MRRIINSTYITLDGAIENPQDWPSGRHISAMEKWVVSTMLSDPAWNNSEVIGDDVAAEIARRKAQDGADIVQYGFGPVTDLLLEHGLLDELRLWVHPFMLGKGAAEDLLFRPGREHQFELVEAAPLASGNVVLTYQPA
jgi:dihydrofolate reductase